MVKLSQSVTGHFVSVIEVSVAFVDISFGKKERGNCVGWEGELRIRFTNFGGWARFSKVGFLSCENFCSSTLGASLIHSQVLCILFVTSSSLHGTQFLSALVRVNPGEHATLFASVEE